MNIDIMTIDTTIDDTEIESVCVCVCVRAYM